MTEYKEKTLVSRVENIKETYIQRKSRIFTWYELVKCDSLWKDLVISTIEDYNRIIVNWKVLSTLPTEEWTKKD